MKTVCDVLGVALCFGSQKHHSPDWQDSRRPTHTNDSVLAARLKTET